MNETVTDQILKAIAEVEKTEPENLDPSLQRQVCTDAIRELVNHNSGSSRLQFETRNHVVEVGGNNRILVDGNQRRTFS
jgi:hypothetical protein